MEDWASCCMNERRLYLVFAGNQEARTFKEVWWLKQSAVMVVVVHEAQQEVASRKTNLCEDKRRILLNLCRNQESKHIVREPASSPGVPNSEKNHRKVRHETSSEIFSTTKPTNYLQPFSHKES